MEVVPKLVFPKLVAPKLVAPKLLIKLVTQSRPNEVRGPVYDLLLRFYSEWIREVTRGGS